MKRIALLTLLLATSLALVLSLTWQPTPAAAIQPGDSTTFNFEILVVRAYFTDRQMVADLAQWNEPWEVNYDKGYVVVEVNRDEYQQLLDAGFRVELDELLTLQINQPLVNLPGQISGIPGYPCYRTVEETFATAEAIATAYPNLATWIDAGDSWEKTVNQGGYDMMVLRLTNAAIPGDKPKLFIMSAVHAREYTTAELVTRFAEYLVENYGTDADVTWLLDYHEVHMMLQANPDGRKQAETGLSWRKNTNQNYCGATSNSRGADLNRNFEFQWGCCGGSSGSQCADTYRGPVPASEPEVQAVQNYVRANFPDQREDPITAAAPITATGVFLDIHSYSQLVLWPWGFTSQLTGNATALQTLGRKFAYFNQYEPDQAISLYPTDGTTDDFAYGELGLAAYTFELGTSFFQSCGVFENTILPDNMPALLYAAKVARTPYMTPAGPDALNPTLMPGIIGPGAVVTLTASINDTRYFDTVGSEPAQNIVAAEYYINTPPWITTTTPIAYPMAAADGAFNSPIEAAIAAIDTAGLSDGRHTIFVRGQDAAGNWGAISAHFLYIIDPAIAPVITGQVRAADTGLPLAATVAAGSLQQVNNDPLTGIYQMLVISGTYDLTAVPADPTYSAATIPDVVAHNYQTVQQNFLLFPYCDIFLDDMESGNPGWTAQSPWAITTESAHSPTHSWTDSPGGNYSNNRNISLTSPTFDLTGYQGITLNFWQICDTEATYDFCLVELSTDGSAWTTIASYDGPHSQWEQISLPMPQLDDQPNARIRFRFTSDVSVVRDGWHIDDTQLIGAGAACTPNLFPMAGFTSTSPDALGETTLFTNTSLGTDLTYAWDFGDGSPLAATRDVMHTYANTGAYTVTLLITNTLGSDQYSDIVRILEPPVAGFTFSESDIFGGVVFTNTSTGDDLGFAWDFGDGSPISSSTHPTHTYTAVGTYTVTLTASNDVDSDTAVASVTITTIIIAPQASFTVAISGTTAVFSNTSIGTDLTYAWDFGDDSSVVTTTHPTHVYAAPGIYTITLTATNAAGSSTATQTITVSIDDYPIKIFLPIAYKGDLQD